MTAYSRVTVVGSRRRVDLVVPADERVGAMAGDLLRLLGEPVAAPPLHRHLVTATGDVIAGDSTLAEAGVADGSVLRLVGEERLPPAPVVYDVAEEVATDRDARTWLFDTTARRALGGVVLAVAVLAAADVVRAAGLLFVPAVLAAGLTGTGVVLGRWGRRPLAAACLLTGVLTGVHHVIVAPGMPDGWRRWTLGALLIAVTPLLFAAAGWRPRGALLGSGTAGVLLALWASGLFLDVPAARVAAVLAVVGVAVLGMLPRVALSLSGVASLDDRRTAGRDVARTDVRAALAAAHQGLTLASVATAVSGAVAGVVLTADLTRWSTPLACLLAYVLASRARAYPLHPQVVALVAAAVVVVLALTRTWADRASELPAGPLALLLGVAVLATFAVALSLPEHGRARLRIALDRLESLAVVAIVPLVVGMFGTYDRLLDMF